MFSAYKKFWTRYADFSGRSSRSDFWWVVLCNFLITLPFSLIALFGFLIPLFSEVYYAGLYDYEPDFSGAMAGAGFAAFIMFLLAIYGFATIVPNLAITVRRLRDAGFHWAFIFLTVGPSIASFIPVLNILAALVSLPCGIALIVLLCQASKPAQSVNGAPYGQQGFQGQQFGQAQQPAQNQQISQPVNQGQQFGQAQQPVQTNHLLSLLTKDNHLAKYNNRFKTNHLVSLLAKVNQLLSKKHQLRPQSLVSLNNLLGKIQ